MSVLRGRTRLAVLLLGALALLAAVAFPFAPVQADQVGYRWPAGAQPATATALPLMPFQPVELTATIPCAAASSLPDGGVLLSTVPLRTDPAAPVLSGLRISVADGSVEVRSAGQLVARRAPATDCDLTVHSAASRTEVLVDGERVATVDRDVRPAVAGFFTDVHDTAGFDVQLTAETLFQSTISPLKAGLAVLCVLALLGALLLVRSLDRQHGHAVPSLRSKRWWRPRLVDGVVVGVLALWACIGPITVDDGYIGGMLRSRDGNDFVGNVYRWLNAPEAPFGWFYEVLYGWGQLGWSAAWLRVPSTLLATACWVLLSRLLLPRLGRFAARRSAPWLAAAAFGAWWLPFNTGLRSEPWVAVGLLAVVCAVERGIATRRVLPLAVGLVIASASLATSPTGIVAFTPFLAALLPLIRLLRARADLRWWPLLAVAAAAPATGLLLMFADQSLAAVSEATRIRQVAAGSVEWYQEYLRYTNLLTRGSVEGPLPRRMPVLLTLGAMAGLLWVWRRRLAGSGIASGPTLRLVLTVALSLGLFTLTPTKWTYHFGVLAGVGAAVLVLALRAFRTAGLAAATAGQPVQRLRALAVGLLVVTALGGLALTGYNQWPYVSNYGLTWGSVAPLVFGQMLAGPLVVAGVLVAAVLLVLAAWLTSGNAADGPALRWLRWVPSPAAVALVLVLATVLLQVGTFVKTSVEHRHTYTMANDSLRALRGTSCGLADYLQVETSPTSGELQPVQTEGKASLDGFAPAGPPQLELAGEALTGWQATGHGNAAGTGPATARTPWYRLTDAQRRGELPLVVTVSGAALGPHTTLNAEFRGGAREPITTALPDVRIAPRSRDLRLMVNHLAPQADSVRLIASDGGPPIDVPLAFSVPRSPVLTPLTELLPRGATVLVDWPVAFHHPCLRMPALVDGAAELPQWRIGTPARDDSSRITYAPSTGGPFSTARMLVTEQRMPMYLRGDPVTDLGGIYRWVPLTAYGRPAAQRSTETTAGWERRAPVIVPPPDPEP